MGRALGDTHLSKVLSRVPDIYEVKLGAQSFVIVATDGAFDPSHYEFKRPPRRSSSLSRRALTRKPSLTGRFLSQRETTCPP